MIVGNLKVTLSPWPRTGMQVLSLLIVAVFLTAVICLLAYRDAFRHDIIDTIKYAQLRIWSTKDDQTIAPSETNFYQIAFWTPSPETAVDLRSLYPSGVPLDKQWQMDVTEERSREFGKYLTSIFGDQLLGYRRTPVFGRGLNTIKNGYWWTITVRTSVSVQIFYIHYKTFWKTNEKIYIETRGDSRYLK